VATWVLSNEFGSIGALFRDIFCSFRSNIGTNGVVVLAATLHSLELPRLVESFRVTCMALSIWTSQSGEGMVRRTPIVAEEATPSLNSKVTSFHGYVFRPLRLQVDAKCVPKNFNYRVPTYLFFSTIGFALLLFLLHHHGNRLQRSRLSPI
jgi:hypothetical protein